MNLDKEHDLPVGVTQFKAQCLALIDDVSQGKRNRVILMKHNHPVAAIVPIEQDQTPLWGALRGTVKVTSGADITKSSGETWKAQE